jgi:hypothetical protein
MDPRITTPAAVLAQQFSLATRLATMLNDSYAAWQQASGDAKRDLARLNADLVTAYDVVEGADAAPTTQAVTTVAGLEQRWKKLQQAAKTRGGL